MIIELKQLPENALEGIMQSLAAHYRQIGIAIVAELRRGELMYQLRRSSSSFAPLGGSEEDPRLYPSVEDAEPETQIYGATRVVLWVSGSVSIQALAAMLAYNGRMSANAVGELVFNLTGSDKQAQDAEAAAKRAMSNIAAHEESMRKQKENTGRHRKRRRQRGYF